MPKLIVYAQRYDATGVAAGSEFLVNTETGNFQEDPVVAALTGGGFVVAWESSGQDGDRNGIYGQRFNADGTTAGDEFRVNTHTPNSQTEPSVIALSNGGFVVTWTSRDQETANNARDGVYGQRYNADGTPAGDEFLVNTTVESSQGDSAGAGLSNGGFVLFWNSFGQDAPGGDGVYGQRYNADGTRAGNEFQVNTETANSQSSPSVTVLSNGGFVVVWTSFNQDGDGGGIYGQRFNADGTTNGDEFQVNQTTDNGQLNPSVTALSDGGFVVTWDSFGQDGSDADSYSVHGRRYNADGTANGDEFQVNTETADAQQFPSVATLSNGNFVVAWESDGQDGDGEGVYGQRFSLVQPQPDPQPEPETPTEPTAGNDRLTGTAGDDTIDGMAGNDIFIGSMGADSLDGGDGDDRVDYADSPDPVNVDLGAGTASGGFAAGDSLTGIEHLTGSAGADTLTGDGNHNRLDGLAGDDSLNGGAGNDWLTGGLGADALDGGEGRDRAIYRGSNEAVEVYLDGTAGVGGHAAGDTLTNIEVLIGSGFDDSLTGDGNDNRFDGGLGDDEVDGGDGNDRLDGRAGDDEIDGGLGADTLIGRAGDDELDGGDGNDLLIGSAGADTLNGGAGDDRLIGGAGADTLTGGAGADTLDGGAGEDMLDGGAGIDWAVYSGSNAAVTVTLVDGAAVGAGGHAQGDALTGIERLAGSAFNDSLTGDVNDNHLDGGAGDDMLTGGAGADTLDGGAGDHDRATYADSNAAVTVVLDEGTTAGMGGHAEGDVLTGIEDLTGSGMDDSLTGNADENRLDGGAGADELTGGAGADTLDGGAGDDTLDGGAGDDTLDGGAGDDLLGGGVGADELTGGDGADTLDGGDGNDELYGGARADELDGGAGDDYLEGGAGADELTGGAGADTFAFFIVDGAVNDTIVDFEDGTDDVDITLVAASLSGI